jgi:DNA-binding NarL/FixJ family response regulator
MNAPISPFSHWSRAPERALIVDSDPTWLHALRRWLAAYGLLSVVTANSMASANQALEGDEDVVITEVMVARESCFGFVARAIDRPSAPVVIAMSDRAPRAHVFRLKDFGVSAYLEKPFDAGALYRCIEQTPAATAIRSSSDAPQLRLPEAGVSATIEAALARQRARHHLTNAEAEVLRCMMHGMRRAEVARERSISVNTVKTQVRSLLWKCGAENIRELVRQAMREEHRSP